MVRLSPSLAVSFLIAAAVIVAAVAAPILNIAAQVVA
jgi:hypothetical protein